MVDKYRVFKMEDLGLPYSSGLMWEVVGPGPDGGPYCVAACLTEDVAKTTATALNLYGVSFD